MCTICACFSPLAFFEDYIKMWYIGSNCSNCKFNTQNIPERKKKKKHIKQETLWYLLCAELSSFVTFSPN